MLWRMIHTVCYLKPAQVFCRVYRPRPRRTAARAAPSRRAHSGPWISTVSREPAQLSLSRFRFLNNEREIQTWNDPGIPKLWLYNLHYFDSPSAPLIRKWVLENPEGHGNGWEPYPLSLRICNWIKFSLSGNALGAQALESLARQAAWLTHTVEYHLLANHLFANAKALIFAGAFFQGLDASEWLSTGLHILGVQLPEQVLEDGGHFERSPMYHALILEDVLDLVNLGRAYPGVLLELSGTASRMLGWLRQMTHPDGRISFFNDAVFGMAPEPAALSEYAGRLGIEAAAVTLGESGYVRLENERAVVLFDAAAIGPDYQPGHAHADTLSFELSVDGRRAIVNSGISTYERCEARQAERGTAAHNTIRVDGQDSSEVWAAFRVARRARPADVKTDCHSFAEASHDGYTRLKDPVIHTRRLDLTESELLITDTLQGRREHTAEIYFHLHPQSAINLQLDPKLLRTEQNTFWYPEFNRCEPNTTVLGQWSGLCPVQFISRIHF